MNIRYKNRYMNKVKLIKFGQFGVRTHTAHDNKLLTINARILKYVPCYICFKLPL